MVGWELIVVMVVPLVVGLASWWTPAKLSRVLSLASGLLSFVLALTLIPARSATALSGWLRVDALSVVFMVTVAFLYMTTAVFAAGDLRPGGDKRYLRRFFAGFNLFAWAMLMATAVNGFALLWVAIEITTIISALLVAIEGTDTATEAAWKYVVIASMGLGSPCSAPSCSTRLAPWSSGAPTSPSTPSFSARQVASRPSWCASPSSWQFWASARRWVSSRCIPGCPTHIPRRRLRFRRCCLERFSR